MAHGGTADWNGQVAQAAQPLRDQFPTALALGMADPTTLAAGLDSLTRAGVTRVVVVRLFVSGWSFLDQTEYLLGVDSTPPRHFVTHGPRDTLLSPSPIAHALEIKTHVGGLVDWPQIGRIVVDRAVAISVEPRVERVLIVAHGMGDPHRNQELLAGMEAAAAWLRPVGFRAVDVATLQEDWAPERKQQEVRIRRFVKDGVAAGDRVLVIPFRVSGFGPYAEVLEGLSYGAGEGFLPHEAVTDWLRATALRVMCDGGWTDEPASCGMGGSAVGRRELH